MFLIYSNDKSDFHDTKMYSNEVKLNRGRTDIMADILEMAMPGIKKTQILQKANLNSEQLLYYLERLQIGNLLVQAGDGSRVYRTTEMGREFLRCHKRLNEFIDDNLVITMMDRVMKKGIVLASQSE